MLYRNDSEKKTISNETVWVSFYYKVKYYKQSRFSDRKKTQKCFLADELMRQLHEEHLSIIHLCAESG